MMDTSNMFKVMATSYNRVYLVQATPSPKFLASLGTSDILKTLGEIGSLKTMKIRFLYFMGCPNAKPALNLLREVLREKGIDKKIEIIEVKSEDNAKK